MSESNDNPNPGQTDPTNSSVPASTVESGAAPAGEATPPAGGADQATPSPDTGKEPPKKTDADPDAALQRAKDRMAKKAAENDGGTQDSPDDGQAPADKDGESTDPSGKQQDDPDKAAAGGEEDDSSSPDSTVQAPEDWPDERKEAFNKLPNDEARSLALDFYKDMQRGYTKASENLAQQFKANETLFTVMKEAQVDGSTAADILLTAKKLEDDPASTLRELAEHYKVDLFAGSDEEIPEFDDPKALAEWLDKRAERKAAAKQQESSRKAEAEKRLNEARETYKRQIEEAASKYEDFGQHRTTVIDRVADVLENGLSVEQAYILDVAYPRVQKLAEDGAKAARELAELRSKQEEERKKSTEPPGNGGTVTRIPGEEDLDEGQRALAKAKRRIAQKAS